MEKIAMSVMTCAIQGASNPLERRRITPNMTPYTKTMKNPSTPLGKPVR